MTSIPFMLYFLLVFFLNTSSSVSESTPPDTSNCPEISFKIGEEAVTETSVCINSVSFQIQVELSEPASDALDLRLVYTCSQTMNPYDSLESSSDQWLTIPTNTNSNLYQSNLEEFENCGLGDDGDILYLYAILNDTSQCDGNDPYAELKISRSEKPEEISNSFTLPPNERRKCSTTGEATFNLTSFEDRLKGGQDNVTVEWREGEGASIIPSNDLENYSVQGSKTITAALCRGECCTNGHTIELEVIKQPSLEGSVSNGTIILRACADDSNNNTTATFSLSYFVNRDLICGNCTMNDGVALQFKNNSGADIDPNFLGQNNDVLSVTLINRGFCSSPEKQFTLQVIPKEPVIEITDTITVSKCGGEGTIEFDLTAQNVALKTLVKENMPGVPNNSVEVDLGRDIQWYSDAGAASLIDSPADYSIVVGTTQTIYARVPFKILSDVLGNLVTPIEDDICYTAPVPVRLISSSPEGSLVSELPLSSDGNEFIQLSYDQNVCQNSAGITVWTNQTLKGFGFTWELPNGGLEFDKDDDMESPTPQIRVTRQTNQTIKLTVSDDCGQTRPFVKFITINSGERADDPPMIKLKGSNNTLVCLDGSYDSYQWGITDKTNKFNIIDEAVSGETFQDWIVGESLDLENKEYWVEVTNDDGCKTRGYFNRVNKARGVVPEFDDLEVAVFPNPNDGVFQVRLSGEASGEVELELYDGVGRRVQQQTLDKQFLQQQYPLNLPELSPGIYLLRIVRYNGRLEQQILEKVVIH